MNQAAPQPLSQEEWRRRFFDPGARIEPLSHPPHPEPQRHLVALARPFYTGWMVGLGLTFASFTVAVVVALFWLIFGVAALAGIAQGLS